MTLFVALFTWAVAIFTNIYIYKLLYGNKMCIIDQSKAFRTIFLILLAPFVSLVLFVKYIIKLFCEISEYLVSKKKRTCINCTKYRLGKCAVYELSTRKEMLCKGEFFDQNPTVKMMDSKNAG